MNYFAVPICKEPKVLYGTESEDEFLLISEKNACIVNVSWLFGLKDIVNCEDYSGSVMFSGIRRKPPEYLSTDIILHSNNKMLMFWYKGRLVMINEFVFEVPYILESSDIPFKLNLLSRNIVTGDEVTYNNVLRILI